MYDSRRGQSQDQTLATHYRDFPPCLMNYQTIYRALSLVSGDLYDIATQTQEIITVTRAQECH